MSEYTDKAEQFLKQAGITFSVESIGKDCPRFCKDNLSETGVNQLDVFPRKTHIHGWHYRCYLTRTDATKTVAFDFWNSYADEEFNFAKKNTQGRAIGLDTGEVFIVRYGIGGWSYAIVGPGRKDGGCCLIGANTFQSTYDAAKKHAESQGTILYDCSL